MRRGSKARVGLLVLAAALLVVPGIPSVLTGHAAGSPSARAIADGTLAAGPPSNWSVTGSVRTDTGVPVVGAQVTITQAPCPVTPDPNDYQACREVATGGTNASGNFSVPIPPVNGSYWLYSSPADGFGGDYRFLADLGGPVGPVNLTVWPYRPYGNATIVLPDYASLSRYACNGQGAGACGASVQVPLLSWTADGAFYVNASDDLVFYSFPNGTAQLIARNWTPLFQNFMNYGGIEDTEWITADGSYVYTYGCPTACQKGTNLEFEAANVTTGAIVTHTWNVTVADTLNNAQGDMIGLDGSYGDADLINQTGVVRLFDLANRTEWVAGRLAFFEANNIYWVPELSSYIDVQAGGSVQDRVVQYRFNGIGFRAVYAGYWGSGVVSELVNGLVYNLTAHQIDFEAGSYGNEYLVTDRLSIGASGVVNASTPSAGFLPPSWPQRKWGEPTPLSSEHRIATNPWGPNVAADYSPLFFNSSWLQDPTTSSWFDTNQTMEASSPQAGNAPETVEGLFYNGTYAIDPASVYCAGTGNKNWSEHVCPLEGTLPNTVWGSVWWFWQIGQPRYPFPASSPIAEPWAPAEPVVRVSAVGATAIRIAWAMPPGDDEPLLNWTVFWGSSPGTYTRSASLPPNATSFQVPGLATEVRYYFGVRALNHHYFGPTGVANGTPLGPPEPGVVAPSGLSVLPGHYPILSWTNPAGPLNGTTVFWGPSCGDLDSQVSLPSVASRFVAPLLPNGTTEYFAVADWGTGGRTDLSNCEGDAPPPPSIVYAAPLNGTGVELFVAQNLSPVFNRTLRYGPPSCDSFPSNLSTGNGGPWAYATGLPPSTSFCFEAASWSWGGESAFSAPFVGSTFGPLPAPPLGVTASVGPQGEVTVAWTNPSGPIVSDSVLWGDSCASLSNSTDTGAAATSWTVGGLPNGTDEWFAVEAVGPLGPSVPSACASNAPAPASVLRAAPAGPGEIGLELSDGGRPAFNHTVGYEPAPCGRPWYVASTDGPSEALTLTGLVPGARYCVQASTVGFGGRSGFGAGVLVRAGSAPPPPALGVAANATGPGSAVVVWTAPDVPATNATVLEGTSCAAAVPMLNASASAGTATLNDLSAASPYCFAVELWNGSLAGPRSANATALTPPFAGTPREAPAAPPASPLPPALLAAAAFVALAAFVVERRLRRPPPPEAPPVRRRAGTTWPAGPGRPR
jgi:hypothetical protein